MAAKPFDLGLRTMEDDSEDHPSMELAGNVQDDDLGVDNKRIESLDFIKSFLFPDECFKGVLEIETELDTWEVTVLLRESGGDLPVKLGAQQNPPKSFPAVGTTEEGELGTILHEPRIQVFFDRILVLPVRIT